MSDQRKFAIILTSNSEYEICKFTNLVKLTKKLSQKKQHKRLFIKKCNKETVQLIAVHCNHQILYELVQNLKVNIPQVKIEDLEKSNNSLSDYKEQAERLRCEKSDKSNKSVSKEDFEKELHEDNKNIKTSSPCRDLTNALCHTTATQEELLTNIQCHLEDYNNATSEDNGKLEESQSFLKSYEIVKNSSTKCTLKIQNRVSKVPCDMSDKKSLIINLNTILPDEKYLKRAYRCQLFKIKHRKYMILCGSLENVTNENSNMESVFDKVPNSKPAIISNVPFSNSVRVLPANLKQEISLDQSNNDPLSKSQLLAINESFKNLLSESQIPITKEFLSNEFSWSWNGNTLVVPQCENIENEQLENSTFELDWNCNKAMLNDTLESIEKINLTINLDNSQEAYRKNSMVYFPPKDSQNSDDFSDSHSKYIPSEHSSEEYDKHDVSNNRSANKSLRSSNSSNNTDKSELNISLTTNICGKSSRNDEEMYVQSAPPKESKRIFRKHLNSKVCPVLSRQIIGRYASHADNILRQIVMPRCHDDRITRIIRYDQLIIEHGNRLCQRYPSPHHHSMIRQRLRQLGRFLLKIRQHCQVIDDYSSVYYPRYYGTCIDVINIFTGFDISTKTYNTPSLATSLGTLLTAAGKTLVSLTIFQDNFERQKQVENFLTLLSNEYGTAVNKVALETQQQVKRKKKVTLPSTDDIKKLDSFLQIQRTAAFENLKQKFSFQDWLKLSESTLISIQLFNRRRPGEMERTYIEDYKNYEKIDPKTNPDGFNALSSECQRLAMEYVRFTIRGKLTRTVPVLLDSELQKCVELILQHRKKAGVRSTNPYVFGTPNDDCHKHTHLQACNLMRRFSFECGADRPETLRGTTLRKHVATLGVNLNLSDSEITDLANFMGHEEKIHREHYRMPIVHREILRMSRLLHFASGKDYENENNFNNEEENDKDINNALENDAAPSTSNCNYNISLKPCIAMRNKENQQNEKSGEKILQNLPLNSYNTSQINSSDSYSSNSDTDTLEKYFSQKKRRSTSLYGKCKRVPWNETEKKIVLDSFGSYIPQKKLPSLCEIQESIKKNPIALKRRTAVMIKAWLMNQRQN